MKRNCLIRMNKNMNDWKKVRLGDYISEYSVKNRNSEDISVYSVTNTKGFCTEYFSKDVSSKDKTNYKIVPRGYFAYNPSRINVGSVDWQRYEDRVIVSPLYNVFAVSEELEQQYLYYFLKSDIGHSLIVSKAEGSVRDNLKIAMLSEFPIPLPPLETQKQIATTLDKVTKIIAESKQLLKKYDLLIKSRFIEMFGDNPIENWNVEKLRNTGNFKNGMNFSYEDNGFEINCLGVGDFKDNSVISETSVLPIIFLNEKPTDEYLLQKEDIVFVRSNGNKDLVGRCVLVYPDTLSTFSGFCIRYRKTSEKLNSIYLLQYLKMPNTRKRMSGRGANIQNLNQQILSNLEIPIPPPALQQQFAAFVQQIDKSKSVIKQSLQKSETLYKSLMQRYFA